jgi:DNA polymerase-3 subunit alpha
MDECRSMGITVLGPDVNASDLNFTVNKYGNIRFGLGGIKGVGSGAVEIIVKEREMNGPFKSVFDFIERVNLTACNKKNLEALCLSGAFDNFTEITREQYFAANSKGDIFMETLIRYGNKFQQDKRSAQNFLFGGMDSFEIAKPEILQATPWNTIERLNKEKDLVGIYLSSHPLDEYYVVLKYICNLGMADFEEAKTTQINKPIILGGIVTNIREGYTKNGSQYAVVKIEDFTGSGEIALFGDDFVNYAKFCRPNMYLFIKGIFTPRKYNESQVDFRISSIQQLPDVKEKIVQNLTVSIPLFELNKNLVDDLSSKIKNNPGNTSLYFKIEDKEKQISITLTTGNQKFLLNKQLIQYLENKNFNIVIT